MKKYKFILLIFTSVLSLNINAQDPHFSQYFASPLSLNPAMTGYFYGEHRLTTNFRNQWWSAGAPFMTNTISFDTKLNQSGINEGDTWAVGVMALYDQSLGGGYKNINASASMAYSKALGADGNGSISAGFQASYGTRVLDFSKLDFAAQFNGSGFDPHLPSNETFGNSRVSYFDINTGLLYTYRSEKVEFYIGGSLYHLTTPDISFLRDGDAKLPMRYTIHTGYSFDLGETGNELFIGGLYMEQNGANEQSIGVAYGHYLTEDATIYAGGWYRINDAIMPYVGLNYTNFQFGFSYDVVNSSLKRVNPKNGSFELSLNYTIKKETNHYNNYKSRRIF